MGITNGLSSLTSSAHKERTKALDEDLRQGFVVKHVKRQCDLIGFTTAIYFGKLTLFLKCVNFGFLKEIICNLQLFLF